MGGRGVRAHRPVRRALAALAGLLLAPGLAHAAPAVAPATPDADLVWRGGEGSVVIDAPSGWHLAPTAPAAIVLRDMELRAPGDPRRLRFPLPPGPVRIEASFSLCEDAGSACVPWTLAATGEVRGRRGRLPLAPPATPTPVTAPTGTVVRVVDVSARWCPPCNRLSAELLHDPDDAAWRAGMPPIEVLDADTAAAWALKHAHRVTGYPTLLALDAQGREVARLVGYPGEAETRAWFEGLAGATPAWTLREAPIDTLSPEQAARAARAFAEAGDADAARRLIPRAAAGVDATIARLHTDPVKADARWLAVNAPPGLWVAQALDAFPALWDDLAPLVARLPAPDVADLLLARAEALDAVAGGAVEAITARLGARALLESSMSGEESRDRAIVTTLAEARARTGDLDGAISLLAEWAARPVPHPGEGATSREDFTFDLVAARLLREGGRPREAVAAGERALARADGDDQRLRAAMALARALDADGRRPEALARIDTVLAQVTLPVGLEVRTHRYAAQARELRGTLAAPGP